MASSEKFEQNSSPNETSTYVNAEQQQRIDLVEKKIQLGESNFCTFSRLEQNNNSMDKISVSQKLFLGICSGEIVDFDANNDTDVIAISSLGMSYKDESYPFSVDFQEKAHMAVVKAFCDESENMDELTKKFGNVSTWEKEYARLHGEAFIASKKAEYAENIKTELEEVNRRFEEEKKEWPNIYVNGRNLSKFKESAVVATEIYKRNTRDDAILKDLCLTEAEIEKQNASELIDLKRSDNGYRSYIGKLSLKFERLNKILKKEFYSDIQKRVDRSEVSSQHLKDILRATREWDQSFYEQRMKFTPREAAEIKKKTAEEIIDIFKNDIEPAITNENVWECCRRTCLKYGVDINGIFKVINNKSDDDDKDAAQKAITDMCRPFARASVKMTTMKAALSKMPGFVDRRYSHYRGAVRKKYDKMISESYEQYDKNDIVGDFKVRLLNDNYSGYSAEHVFVLPTGIVTIGKSGENRMLPGNIFKYAMSSDEREIWKKSWENVCKTDALDAQSRIVRALADDEITEDLKRFDDKLSEDSVEKMKQENFVKKYNIEMSNINIEDGTMNSAFTKRDIDAFEMLPDNLKNMIGRVDVGNERKTVLVGELRKGIRDYIYGQREELNDDVSKTLMEIDGDKISLHLKKVSEFLYENNEVLQKQLNTLNTCFAAVIHSNLDSTIKQEFIEIAFSGKDDISEAAFRATYGRHIPKPEERNAIVSIQTFIIEFRKYLNNEENSSPEMKNFFQKYFGEK